MRANDVTMNKIAFKFQVMWMMFEGTKGQYL